ncbi:golgin subfamily A member 6-like protein 22 [Microplitis demolitor]|uniref:golgin subfamily A member 6-like protein 22 n=1 Tax=Microplitis demolitor TaxID=69319 RepID=UPI00235B60CA|nr:golgin subfamily A member 6-like protein 22 [Microplitis demolitor]
MAGDKTKEKSDEEREGSTYKEMTSDEERHERGKANGASAGMTKRRRGRPRTFKSTNSASKRDYGMKNGALEKFVFSQMDIIKAKAKKVENTDNINEVGTDWCRAGFQLARTPARNSRGSLQVEKDSNEEAKELDIIETINDRKDKQKDEVGKKTREQATQTGMSNWSQKQEMKDSEKNSEEKMWQLIAEIEDRVKTKVEELIMKSMEEIKACTRQETSKIGAQIIRSKCKEDQVEKERRHRQEIERLEKEIGKREQRIKEKDRVIKELSEKIKKEKENKTNIPNKTKATEEKKRKATRQSESRHKETRKE